MVVGCQSLSKEAFAPCCAYTEVQISHPAEGEEMSYKVCNQPFSNFSVVVFIFFFVCTFFPQSAFLMTSSNP